MHFFERQILDRLGFFSGRRGGHVAGAADAGLDRIGPKRLDCGAGGFGRLGWGGGLVGVALLWRVGGFVAAGLVASRLVARWLVGGFVSGGFVGRRGRFGLIGRWRVFLIGGRFVIRLRGRGFIGQSQKLFARSGTAIQKRLLIRIRFGA